MSMQDIVSDFVARVNNALTADLDKVTVIKSKLILSIVKKLTTMGLFVKFDENELDLVVYLQSNKLAKLKRISKPGQRVYTSYSDLPKIVGGRGFNLLTTSAGVFSSMDAKEKKMGGELLMQIIFA